MPIVPAHHVAQVERDLFRFALERKGPPLLKLLAIVTHDNLAAEPFTGKMLEVARREAGFSLVYRPGGKGSDTAGILQSAHPGPCGKAGHGVRPKVLLHPQGKLALLEIIADPIIGGHLVTTTKIPPGLTGLALELRSAAQAPKGPSL